MNAAGMFLLVVALPLVACSSSPSELVEVFEMESRSSDSRWEFVAFVNEGGGPSVKLGPGIASEAPAGFEWATDWILDGSYGGNDGWMYIDNGVARSRRRRWVRILAATKAAERPSMKAKAVPVDALVSPRNKTSVKERAQLVLNRIRDDFTFRGFGVGVSMGAMGYAKRPPGFVVQLPLTPNFASWEKRRYLPMVTALFFAFPPSAAVGQIKQHSLVVTAVLSISYPLDVVKGGLQKTLARARRANTEQEKIVKIGARAVQRVGFSVASRVELDPATLKVSLSAVQLRPWFMYAPGLRLIATALDAALTWILAQLTLIVKEREMLLLDNDEAMVAPQIADEEHDHKAANASSTPLLTSRDESDNSTVLTPLNASASPLSTSVSSSKSNHGQHVVAATTTKKAPSQKQRQRKTTTRFRRRPMAIRAVSRAVDASRTMKAWWDSKTTLLGYSFLPLERDLYKYQRRLSPPVKPWRGSMIFLIRPFHLLKFKAKRRLSS